MARCYCRWRNVLICVCSPCICLALLFVYIAVTLCMSMNAAASPGTTIGLSGPGNSHFVASGTSSNGSFAPLPKTFWDLHSHGGAMWNHLQLAIDQYFNPLLHPNNRKKTSDNSTFYESLLRRSSSEITDLNRTRKSFDELPQQLQEFASYMQMRDYPTLIQPDGICGAGAEDEKEPPLLLLAIKTTELNFKNRQAIRKTWGQVGWVAAQKSNSSRAEHGGGYIRRVFLLGKENQDELGVDLSELIQLESKHYGDILQWDFKDTFFNLTLKDVLFWNWFSRFCGRTLFVFKGDDDVFVNTPKMISYLQDQLGKPKAHKTMKSFMVGDVIGEAKPNRDNSSKYFIPESFYKGLYPAYAGGGGVVYSGLLTKRLHNMSKRVHLFPIDDVYVGMCMIRLNAHPVHHPAFLTFDFPEKEEEELCSYHRILLVHKRNPNQVVKLWSRVKMTQTQCWDVPLRSADDKKIK